MITGTTSFFRFLFIVDGYIVTFAVQRLDELQRQITHNRAEYRQTSAYFYEFVHIHSGVFLSCCSLNYVLNQITQPGRVALAEILCRGQTRLAKNLIYRSKPYVLAVQLHRQGAPRR